MPSHLIWISMCSLNPPRSYTKHRKFALARFDVSEISGSVRALHSSAGILQIILFHDRMTQKIIALLKLIAPGALFCFQSGTPLSCIVHNLLLFFNLLIQLSTPLCPIGRLKKTAEIFLCRLLASIMFYQSKINQESMFCASG